MSKYCPSCGKANSDLLQSCWNCGQYIGRGKVDDLRTPESAQNVQASLKLDKREVTAGKAYMDSSDSDIGLVTIYGVTKKDLDAILTKNNIQVDKVAMPGLCTPDEMLTQSQARRQEADARSGGGGGGSYSGTGSGSYYYNDPAGDYCCYYCCMPRPYYGRSSGCSSSSTRTRGSSSDCDCSDSGSDNDAFAIIAVILLLIAVIGVLIFLGPELIAAGVLIINIAISVVLLLFNILTLGIYRDDLSRQRLRILKADQKNLDTFMKDIVAKQGLPRMPGYWSQGFIMMRYGALFTMAGLVIIIGMYFTEVQTGRIYLIPAVIIVGSLLLFFGGNYAKNKKIAEVKRTLDT